jgi:hypothetical protein
MALSALMRSACRPHRLRSRRKTSRRGWPLGVATPTFDQRIDHVFATNEMAVVGCDLLGESPNDRTPSGLWPSDHAGVLVTYLVP